MTVLLALGCVPGGVERTKQARTESPAIGDAGSRRSNDAGTERPVDRDAGMTPPPRDGGTPDGGDLCIDGPMKSPPVRAVYYGTTQPTHVPLTPGQILAVGEFSGCSGLLITPTWVLTAEHCGLRRGQRFCMGSDPGNANVCIPSVRVVDNPSADMTLVELDRDARTMLSDVEPVPIFTGTLDSSWIGETGEAAGYGQQETGRSGEREFTAERIVRIQGNLVTIDGEGRRGVCFGDSGGPLFVIAPDGTPRVIGDLSYGDPSCVGRDNYTRVDRHRGWIEGYTGPTIEPGPQPCGDVTYEGSCDDTWRVATYCETDELQNVSCTETQVCGWSTAVAGWRCLEIASDPCGGVTPVGACTDNVLSWCAQGQLFERQCAMCGETCIPNEDPLLGSDCIASNCGEETFFGRCDGDTVIWCNREGVLEQRNCGSSGCGWVSDETGYYCQ